MMPHSHHSNLQEQTQQSEQFHRTASPHLAALNDAFGNTQYDIPPAKRNKSSPQVGNRSPPAAARRRSSAQSLIGTPEPKASASPEKATNNASAKSKRVRTGCLTCRERHLKCDEATPDCMNCRKSNRACKRGVRLNFIDIQVGSLDVTQPTPEWAGRFSPFPLESCPF
jgi:hypothetical protein